MGIMKKPGASLLALGVGLIVVSSFIGAIPIIGGVVAPIAFIGGLFGLVGGGYLIARSIRGPQR